MTENEIRELGKAAGPFLVTNFEIHFSRLPRKHGSVVSCGTRLTDWQFIETVARDLALSTGEGDSETGRREWTQAEKAAYWAAAMNEAVREAATRHQFQAAVS